MKGSFWPHQFPRRGFDLNSTRIQSDGNLFKHRFVSMQNLALIESRVPVMEVIHRFGRLPIHVSCRLTDPTFYPPRLKRRPDRWSSGNTRRRIMKGFVGFGRYVPRCACISRGCLYLQRSPVRTPAPPCQCSPGHFSARFLTELGIRNLVTVMGGVLGCRTTLLKITWGLQLRVQSTQGHMRWGILAQKDIGGPTICCAWVIG